MLDCTNEIEQLAVCELRYGFLTKVVGSKSTGCDKVAPQVLDSNNVDKRHGNLLKQLIKFFYEMKW